MPSERAATGAAVRSVGMPARRGSQGMSASGVRTGLSVLVALAPGVPIVAGGIVAEGATISVSGLPVRDSYPAQEVLTLALAARRASPERCSRGWSLSGWVRIS